MGREKFKILTGDDSIYMHDYLCIHEQEILNEFCESSNVDVKICKNFGERLNILTSIERSELYTQYIYWEMQTEFLYDINEKRRNKIRSTIRARRMSLSKNKKQITIDAEVHYELKKYAKEHNQVLSDAIKSLLNSYNEVNT